MHQALCRRLLERQARTVNTGPVRARLLRAVELDGTRALVSFRTADREHLLAFDGPNYDAEPLAMQVLRPDTQESLPGPEWPAGLYFGSDHPVLGRAWTCVRGLYEYYCHPSHLTERWDQQRYALRFEILLGQLLDKAAVPR